MKTDIKKLKKELLGLEKITDWGLIATCDSLYDIYVLKGINKKGRMEVDFYPVSMDKFESVCLYVDELNDVWEFKIKPIEEIKRFIVLRALEHE